MFIICQALRDNSQIEIIINWENWYVCNNLKEIYEKTIALYENNNLVEKMKINNINRTKNLFNAKNTTKKLEDIFNGNLKFYFDFNNELKSYIKNNMKTSKFDLFRINIEALYDKFINKA